MTNKEAINLLKRTRPKGNSSIDIMLNEALDKAISALENQYEDIEVNTTMSYENCKYFVQEQNNTCCDAYDHPSYDFLCKKTNREISPFIHCKRCKYIEGDSDE